MKHWKLLCAVLLVIPMMSLSLFAQKPLTNTMAAVGVLGTSDFVTNTNYTAPTRSTFAEPAGVAIDPTTGKMFVADRDNRRVLRFSATAKLTDGAQAEAVFGQPDYTTRTANTGGISASTMNNPNAVCVDAAGRLWVADRDNHRVLRFDNASTKSSSTAADGVLGQPDFATNTAGTTAAKMSAPAGLFIDNIGRLWVADRANNRILRFDAAATKTNGAAADGVLGQADFTTGTSGTTASTMNAPWGVTADGSGTVWVADRSNSRVLRFDSASVKANGASADGVLGQATFTTSLYSKTQAGLGEPRGVAVDMRGRLYVADEGNTRIMVYTAAASKANGDPADYVLGQADFVSDAAPNPPTASSLCYPLSLFIDNQTNQVWVPDLGNHRVLRFEIGPQVAVSVLGANDFVTNTNYAAPSVKTFAEPVSVAVDRTTGKLFVADRDNRRVLRFGSAEKLANGSSAEAVFGQPDFTTRTANTGGISASTMNNPNSVSVDANGRLWVADRDNHRVLRFDNASAKASSAAADGVLGQPDFATNTTGAAGGKMNAPACVYADANGRVWVADRANNRVLRFDAAASKANGAAPNGVLGQDGYSSTTSGTTASTMSAPWGVFFDVNGRLWVADRSNSRVLRFDNAATKSNGAAADGVLGQPSFTTSVFSKTQSGLGEPRGVAVDGAGKLFVADEGNTRIMVFDSAGVKANGADAQNVFGQVDFTSDAAPDPPTANSLNYPISLCIDNLNGQIWVADPYNHRVLRFAGQVIAEPAPTFAAAPKTVSYGSIALSATKRDSVTVSNGGTAALQIDSVRSDNAAFTVTPSGVTTVAASGSQKFYITFAPTAAGAKTANIVFYHNAASKKDTVKVDGTGTLSVMSIKAARLAGAGATVLIEGIATRVKGNYTYLQDTSAALVLYMSSGAFKDSVNTGAIKAGDKISIQGKISVYNSLYEIVAADLASFTRTSRGNTLPVPVMLTLKDIATKGSAYQAQLVKVIGVSVASTDAMFLPAHTYLITDKTDSSNAVALRIGNATDTDADSCTMLKTITFTGPLGQFSSSDATKGFQLMPVLSADVTDNALSVDYTHAEIPGSYELSNNYPNPFNPSTTIRYALPEQSRVSVKIYSVLGQEVRTLVNDVQSAGYFNVVWNGTNNNGSLVTSGIYIVRILAQSGAAKGREFVQSRKMLLMK
jgi:sugar lactone lactonase YvrE